MNFPKLFNIAQSLKKIFFAAIFFCFSTTLFAQVKYVSTSGGGLHDGSSWNNAYDASQLQMAINSAIPNSQIWVAQGVYKPTDYPNGNNTSNLSDLSFVLKSGVAIYGGFIGNETVLTQRNAILNTTLLSGNVSTFSTTAFCNHVIISSGDDSTTVLDGFHIESGYGQQSGSIIVNGQVVIKSHGAGLYARFSAAKFNQCIFANNNSTTGAGAYLNHSSNGFTNCIFDNNLSSSNTSGGGGIHAVASNFNCSNCVFYNNFGQSGGGIYQAGCASYISNCTFYHNISYSDAWGIFSVNCPNSFIANCLVWGVPNSTSVGITSSGQVPTISYTSVEDVLVSGTNNNTTNPLFIDASNPKGIDNIWATDDDGLTLQFNSPAKDAGDNAVATATDIRNKIRVQAAIIDLGAYENQCPSSSIIYVDSAATGLSTGATWADAYTDLQYAINTAAVACNGAQIWVKKGTYKPTLPPTDMPNGTDRFLTFELKNKVAVYGGFNGTENYLSQRNPKINLTILSGDIGVANNNNDNSYHIVLSNGNDSTAILDGFTIQNGLANSGFSIALQGNTVYFDGGAAIFATHSSAIINQCILQNNFSTNLGGAIYADYSNNTFSNLVLTNNYAQNKGGALFEYSSTLKMNNCVLADNTCTFEGGAMYLWGAVANLFSNCTFYNNTSAQGAAIFSKDNDFCRIQNCIVWNNQPNNSTSIFISGNAPTVNYCAIQNGFVGTGNTSNNPLFSDSSHYKGADNIWATNDDGLIPVLCSPIKNIGTLTNSPTYDLTGINRTSSNGIDLGAYKISSPAVAIDASQTSVSCNGSVTFTATTVNGGSAPTFQWKKNGNVVGNNQPFYTAINLNNNDTITCEMSSNAPCASSAKVVSNAIGITVIDLSARIYVNAAATGNNNGSTWADAFTDLESALEVSCSNAEIWVAKGIYKPSKISPIAIVNNPTAKANTFFIPDGKSLYGGFAGNETQLSQRNIQANTTILSGDLDNNDTNSDSNFIAENYTDIVGNNATHVVTINGISNPTRLDGFTITAGLANVFTDYLGITTANTMGSGLFIENSNGGLTISKCVLTGNSNYYGGTLYSFDSKTNIEKCVFANNYSFSSGAATLIEGGHAAFTNTVFYNNFADGSAAVAVATQDSIDFINCTFYNNATNNNSPASFLVSNSACLFSNCILWNNFQTSIPEFFAGINNITANNNIIKGGLVGNNLNIDPQFINANNPQGADGKWGTADDGLELLCFSPALNTGNNAMATSDDIISVPRPQFLTVDMGAYEATALGYTPSIIISAAKIPNCFNAVASFKSTTTNAGSSPVYHWFKNGNIITGADSASYTDSTFANNDSITCLLIANAPCLTNIFAMSNAVKLNFVNNPSTKNISTSICSGSSYSVGSSTFNATGNYIIHLQNYLGCDSLVTLNLLVNNPSTKNISTSICSGSSYSVGSSSFNATGIYTIHLQNYLGCDSLVTLNLTVTNPSTKNIAASICSGNIYSVGSSSFNATGIYTVHLQNYLGCDSVVTLNLVVNNPSTKNISASICSGSSYSVGSSSFNATGIYAIHLQNYLGCDSVVTLNLVVNNPSTKNIAASICSGSSYSVGSSSFNATGIYTIHLQNYLGCDSLVTLNLTVTNPSTKNITTSICSGSSYGVGSSSFNATGIYTIHLQNYLGCDSLVTLNLTVTNPSTKNITTSICSGSSYSVGSSSFNATGIYTIHLQNYLGCDSVVTLNLVVNNPSTKNISASICSGSSYSVGSSTFNATGIYTIHLQNYLGCDSVVTLNLIVNNPSSKNIAASICSGSSYSVGSSSFNATGIYTIHLQNYLGCDSVVTLNLLVNNPSTKNISTSICSGSSYSVGSSSFNATGIYTIHLQNYLGCDSLVTLNLLVNNPSTKNISAS
ncbi:MAG: hypothetical protein RL708_707, partial [Bacteroidota bacterium]